MYLAVLMVNSYQKSGYRNGNQHEKAKIADILKLLKFHESEKRRTQSKAIKFSVGNLMVKVTVKGSPVYTSNVQCCIQESKFALSWLSVNQRN